MRLALGLALVGFGALGGCSFLVDTNVVQCTSDADCESYGIHPSCVSNVCVDSGLGPPGCFFGTPSAQAEFANQCTTSETLQFDNCARLGICDLASSDAAFARASTPSGLGSIPPPVNTQPTPTTPCNALGSTPIYITGSTNLPPLIKAVQPLLYQGNPSYVAVFAPQTSCKGAASVLDVDPTKHVIKNVANSNAIYYDAAGMQQYCLLDAAGNTVDIGESDVFPTSCGYASSVANTADYSGPILTIAFVVPSLSKQMSISGEAAHLMFGDGGGNGRTAPWLDPNFYFTRSSGTGTTQLVARTVGVDPAMFWGIDRLSAGNLVASMETSDPSISEKVIGILSADFADRARANLRELAFQQRGQTYGYLPDSNASSLDKKNVRDGHYPIWGAIHLLAATTSGVPSQTASAFLGQFTVPKLDPDLVDGVIDSGFVPPCAMKVSRSTELGPLSVYQPPFECTCFYEKKVNGKTSCTACTTAADCGASAPACNYGYCEKQ